MSIKLENVCKRIQIKHKRCYITTVETIQKVTLFCSYIIYLVSNVYQFENLALLNFNGQSACLKISSFAVVWKPFFKEYIQLNMDPVVRLVLCSRERKRLFKRAPFPSYFWTVDGCVQNIVSVYSTVYSSVLYSQDTGAGCLMMTYHHALVTPYSPHIRQYIVGRSHEGWWYWDHAHNMMTMTM